MSAMILLPMAVCLYVGFAALGVWLTQTWTRPKVFYPRTMNALRERLLKDRSARYLYRRYLIWCSVTGTRVTPEGYLLLSVLGASAGFLAGLMISNAIVSLALFLLFLSAPSLVLYARYTVKINHMIASFCEFVDLFSRHYSSRKNIILAFRSMVEECPKELQAELILLNNTLTDGGSPVAALESFAERLRHQWADDFATYVISGLEGETEDIQTSLNRLTNEMFVQQDERSERKSEIYAIWISLLVVIVICVLFIPYNQTLLPQSYRLYFFTADGQALLALAVMVWSLSVLLAFIWGRRHG